MAQKTDHIGDTNKMVTMKLYTEEQVVSMLDRARMHKQDDTEMFTNEYLLSQATPIELPSDKEIEEQAKDYADSTDNKNGSPDWATAIFDYVMGAKWMRDKIQNK